MDIKSSTASGKIKMKTQIVFQCEIHLIIGYSNISPIALYYKKCTKMNKSKQVIFVAIYHY